LHILKQALSKETQATLRVLLIIAHLLRKTNSQHSENIIKKIGQKGINNLLW
jgi:hypothetical protein